MSNFSLIAKLLVKIAVFKYYLSQKINEVKFIDLYIHKSRVITIEKLLNIYQYKI